TSSRFYYNIGYDVYGPDTAITTWTGNENSSAVVNLWNNAGADPKSQIENITVSNTFNLAGSVPGYRRRGDEPPARALPASCPAFKSGRSHPAGSSTQTLLDVSGPYSIASIKLNIPGLPSASNTNMADLLTNLWLKIAFDGERSPSVYAPIGSFFAMGQFAFYPTRSLPVGIDSNNDLYCFFPMPFARRAVIQMISHRAGSTTNIHSEIQYQPFTNSLADVGCFKTQFRSEIPTTNGSDITLLDAEGAGHLVGIVMSMMGPLNRGFLEGDERIYVDDSQTPAFYGTGTEDFFNGGWYFQNGLFSLPTHGNTADLSDTNYNYTSAYRFFLSDAIPFRKHITVGIQHGGVDEVSENVWTLAYYYYQPAPRSVLSDQLNVGDAASETAHSYSISNQTWSGTNAYTFEGNFDSVIITNTGRADMGFSQFTMALPPNNAGAILRRQFDQSIPNQSADVYVDGALVGTWYCAGSNPFHCWRDSDFMIPVSCTSGKSSVQIKVSPAGNWTEYNYWTYSLVPDAPPMAPTLTKPQWTGAGGGRAFQFTFTGSSNTTYDVWASSNLSNWQWLGAATETSPGQYRFTDSVVSLSYRFYRVHVP
ncbi:MAG TPA: glycoside hydrolase family 172 protein, partial [Verrucomicrobiae bacterium]|nr:glycoside hydrolase family 172 protein [Verrucomicrobiae bacterium]